MSIHLQTMKNAKPRDIGEIVKELQSIVGIREVAIWPDVPPGTSLEALREAYKNAGLGLRRKYLPVKINLALEAIYRDLERQVYG
ncbi:hypothetical protein HYY71_05655 [Candidatus Woesearchaeota archaeon]|nr:hypothetical protein [Candidatus Woesearchaeota archaeon]